MSVFSSRICTLVTSPLALGISGPVADQASWVMGLSSTESPLAWEELWRRNREEEVGL